MVSGDEKDVYNEEAEYEGVGSVEDVRDKRMEVRCQARSRDPGGRGGCLGATDWMLQK